MVPEGKRILLAVVTILMVTFFFVLNSNPTLQSFQNYYINANDNATETVTSVSIFLNKTVLHLNKTLLNTNVSHSVLRLSNSDISLNQTFSNEILNETKQPGTVPPTSPFIKKPNTISSYLTKTLSNYTLNTSGCRIPYLDPWHPSITHLVKSLGALKCNGESLVKQNGSRLQIDQQIATKVTKDVKEIDCYYNIIFRAGNNKSDNKYDIGKEKFFFYDDTIIPHEFVKVTCTLKNSTIYTDYFAFIIKKPLVEERCQKAKPRNTSETFRFIFIGMDSVSKSQYLRHMKKTQAFIEQNLDAIELHGYTKVGLNTYPNLVAMLANKTFEEIPNMSVKPANVLPLIWNDLAKEGYRTLLAEDIPQIAIFNYAKPGFFEQPTDYYLRPFSWAAEQTIVKKSKRGCWRDRLEASSVLQWSMDFLNTFANEKVFSLTFITRLSHDNLNEVSFQDEPYVQHFKQLEENGHFNNSIVFFFGDHGFRFGSMRATYIGRMEDMLPFYFVILPPWFKDKYPLHYKNLKTNEHRLTTAFDIYATILDIKNFTGQTETQHFSTRGISLFSEIPETRTCEDASIPIEYCACVQEDSVSLNDSTVVQAAKKVVESVNSITKSQRQKCALLTYNNVTNASRELVTSGKGNLNSSFTLYRISVEVEPSKGIFEGVVWFTKDKNAITVEKHIDRINLYGNQSSCVTESKLKPYCYCGS